LRAADRHRGALHSQQPAIDASITAGRGFGWFGALRARHFGESPLVEDNSARSPAYTTIDGELGFRSGHNWLVALDVFNITINWNDIEYYNLSRLLK
jgi:hypothetical protein